MVCNKEGKSSINPSNVFSPTQRTYFTRPSPIPPTPTKTMTFLPFPEIPYKIVHSGDIVFLLSLGFIYEFVIRIYQHRRSRRTRTERNLSINLATLRYEAAKKRALGPSAFVETAKLERAVLATEKELAKLVEKRAARKARAAKIVKKCNLAANVLILLTYWGVAMVAIDGSRLDDNNNTNNNDGVLITDVERATEFWKGLLFPLSYNMMAYKVTGFGIDKEMRPSCVGALAVVWAARVTCGEAIDCAIEWKAAR